MVRPEVKMFFSRYAQALIGSAIALVSLYWTFSIPGVLRYITGAIALLGLALAIDGFRRGRLRPTGDVSEGLVEIDERRITWMTANWGGSVSINDLTVIELGSRQGNSHWRIRDAFGSVLLIPYTARGADGLIDAFGALDGFDLSRVAQALEKEGEHLSSVWIRSKSNAVDPLT